jgi:RNA polymerase sigma-70 factor (ECF subfamily)
VFVAASESSCLEQQVADIFVALRESVYRYLLANLGDPSDAEDLAQETFIRLFKDSRKGRRINNVQAWLLRVAHNLACDLVRRRSLADHTAESLEGRRPGPSAEELVLARERQEQLDAVWPRLSRQERLCMELRAEGLRYREIGEVLGIRVPTVQTVLSRAIRKFVDQDHE